MHNFTGNYVKNYVLAAFYRLYTFTVRVRSKYQALIKPT